MYSTIDTVTKKIDQRVLVQMLNDEVRAEESVVTAGSFVVGQVYTITTIGTTDFTLIGAASNTVGLEFIATGIGTGTGTATTKIIDLDDPLDLVVIRFNEAAEESQGEIDPYLRGRYTLPMTVVPKIILSISDSFTIYHIYERRNRENMPDSIISIRKEGLKLLEQIQKGMLDIGIADEPQDLSNEIKTNKTSSDRIFNTDMWDKF